MSDSYWQGPSNRQLPEEEPQMPAGGWPKPKGWNEESERWMRDCSAGGAEYATRMAAERRAKVTP